MVRFEGFVVDNLPRSVVRRNGATDKSQADGACLLARIIRPAARDGTGFDQEPHLGKLCFIPETLLIIFLVFLYAAVVKTMSYLDKEAN